MAKLEARSLLLLCLAIFIGSAVGLAKSRKDSSHLGYFYETPEHGFKLPGSNEETKEVQEATEEMKEDVEKEIEKEFEEKFKENESLHFHGNEYIPPRHQESERERERRHGFRRKHGRHHSLIYE